MKKILFGILLLSSFSLFAQVKISEPTFAGEAFIINPDQSILKLEKERIRVRTRADAGAYLTGIGKVKSKIEVIGCCSGASFTPNGAIKLVVRAVNNQIDPLTIINVFQFKKTKNKRLAEIDSFGTFSGGSSNNLSYLEFVGEKYGEDSYLLTIPEYDIQSEYGVIVSNPNAGTELQNIVSTFGVK